MSKKFLVTVLVILCAMAAFCGGGKEEKKDVVVNTNSTTKAEEVTSLQTSGSIVADVELIKKTSITKGQLDERVQLYKSAGADVSEEDALNELINSELMSQSIARDNIDIDAEFSNYVLSAASYYASQYGVTFEKPEDVDAFFTTLGGSTEAFANSLKGEFENVLISQYIQDKFASDFASIPAVTDEDITTFFESNKAMLSNSEKVKLAHIFFPVIDAADEAKVKDAAESVYKQIKAGTLTFEKAVSTYSQDASNNENGGILGWVNKNETELEKAIGADSSAYHKQLFTEDTYNKLFAYDEGEITEVLKTSQGYHIFKIIKHNPVKALTLGDKVYPEISGTVYDFCTTYIAQAYQSAAMNACGNKLIESLRAEAKITLY